MNREIAKIRQRLAWLEDLEKEIHYYRKSIEESINKIERRLK